MAELDPDVKLEGPRGGMFVDGRPADDALLALLAQMVVSDGVVHEGELGFLAKVRPGLSRAELTAWAKERAGARLDLDAVAAAMTEPDDRWRCLRFVARMAWKDGELAPQERDLLQKLSNVFGMPPGAVDRVLMEMNTAGFKERLTSQRILEVLVGLHWDAVQLASGALVSDDLLAATPPGAEIVARVGLEKVEVLAICTEGLVARFQEGATFLAWGDIVAWTRSRVLGESVRLHTETGASWSLVDSRMTGVASLLDRLLDPRERPRGAEPVVQLLRGE